MLKIEDVVQLLSMSDGEFAYTMKRVTPEELEELNTIPDLVARIKTLPKEVKKP